MRCARTFGLLVVIAMLSPIAAGESSLAAAKAHAKGNKALDAGKYEAAIQNYEKARTLAGYAGDAQYRAMAMYGLARANARSCRSAVAEQWFRESIALRETLPDSERAYLTQNWLEFGRFLVSQDRVEEGIKYYELAVPKLEGIGIEQLDPIGYADLLDDIVAAYAKIGKTEESKPHAVRAAELRQKYPDRRASFHAVPYPTDCATKAQ